MASVGVGPADEHLHPAAVLANLDDDDSDAVAGSVRLPAHAVLAREVSLHVPEADHQVLPLVALDLAADQLADPSLVLVVEDVALRLADALGEALLDGLGDDAPEVLHVELVDALVVLDGHLPRVPVDGADQVLTLAEALAHGGGHRLLQGAEDDFPRDVLHRVERVDRLEEGLGVHGSRSGQ